MSVVIESEAAPRDWALITYLCGDNPKLESNTRRQVEDIRAAGGSPRMYVAVQWDLPTGATRAVAADGGGWAFEESLGAVNTGDPECLVAFLRWALDCCPSTHVVVAISGTGLLDPRASTGGPDSDRSRLFTIADDTSARDALSLSEMGTIFKRGLAASSREQIDILALDMRELQFLEVAYELEGSVDILVAPQTRVPDSGWDFGAVLREFKSSLDAGSSPFAVRQLARLLVQTIGAAYETNLHGALSLSALDLRCLKNVTSAFDTLSLAMVHSVGEELVWQARQNVAQRLKPDRPTTGAVAPTAGALSPPESSVSALVREDEWLYDLPEMLGELRKEMDQTGDDGLLRVVVDHFGHLDPTRFARSLQSVEDACFTAGSRLRVAQLESCILDPPGTRRRLRRVLGLAQDAAGLPGEAKCEAIQNELEALLTHPKSTPEGRRTWLEGWSAESLDALEPALAGEYRVAQRQQQRLKHLAELTARVLAMLRPAEPDQIGKETGTLVIEHFIGGDPGGKVHRHGGVSLFRPRELDQLIASDYLHLKFNKRIHWTVLLAVVNLIGHHPRALWRILSAVLATADNTTRGELLARITGPDSVIASFKDQFVVLAPVTTMVLSLEPDPASVNLIPPALRPASAGRRSTDSQAYRVRLERAEREAIIDEVISIVDPAMLKDVLDKLVGLLERATPVAAADVALIESIGETIGEDVLQDLGVRLAEAARTSKGHIHLQLQIPRDLMPYPWELMHHKSGWLSEHFALGRQVFMRASAGRTRTRIPGPMRALVIGNPTSEEQPLPYAAREAEAIVRSFETLGSETDGLLDFKRERDACINQNLTAFDLRQKLRQGHYDIVHFAGHAVFDPNRPESSAWMLSDGPLSAQAIRNTLSWCEAQPWLVFANACEAGMDGTPKTYQGQVFGLASAFLDQGVTACIAPLWRIDDSVAAELAQIFYQQLLKERQTVGESLRRAKAYAKRKYYDRVLRRSGGSDGALSTSSSQQVALVSWAGMVLYGNSTATIGQRLGAPAPIVPPTIASDDPDSS